MKKMNKIFTLLVALFCCLQIPKAQTVKGKTELQNKPLVHVLLDYQHYSVFKEQLEGNNISESMNSGGVSLALLYSLNFRTQMGVGVEIGQNGIPFFASFRFHPFGMSGWKDGYVFTNLGYSPFSSDDNIYRGIYWKTGLGYTKMFRKHFGLNFQIGYQLRQYQDIPLYKSVSGKDEAWGLEPAGKISGIFHTLVFGVGVIF